MTFSTRRDFLQRAAVFTLGLQATRSMLADEPHVSVSPLNKLSDEDEIALGQRFAESLEKEVPVVSSRISDGYLNSMVQELARNSQRPNLPYSVKLINSCEPNALSLPGGLLYVNRGLIELVKTEDELAAALSHEVGHVVARHALNRILLNLEARALLKPVLNNLHKHNGVVDRIILGFGGAVAMLAMLHFSRGDEAQADLLGFYEMLRSGKDPRGFLALFEQLFAIEHSSGEAHIPFLSSHPPTQERAAAIRRELNNVTLPTNPVADSVKFHVVKTSMALLPSHPKITAQQRHSGGE